MWDEKKFFDDYVKAEDKVKADEGFLNEMKDMLNEDAGNAKKKKYVRFNFATAAIAAVFVFALVMTGLKAGGFFNNIQDKNVQSDSADANDTDAKNKDSIVSTTKPFAGKDNKVIEGQIGEESPADTIKNLLDEQGIKVSDENGNVLTDEQVEKLRINISGNEDAPKGETYEEYSVVSKENESVSFRIYESGNVEVINGNEQ